MILQEPPHVVLQEFQSSGHQTSQFLQGIKRALLPGARELIDFELVYLGLAIGRLPKQSCSFCWFLWFVYSCIGVVANVLLVPFAYGICGACGVSECHWGSFQDDPG